jgi:hypothetical protein
VRALPPLLHRKPDGHENILAIEDRENACADPLPETLGSADELIEDEMEKSSEKLLFSPV